MLQPTGSVYLDAPRPARRRPEPARSELRVTVAGLLATIGILCLTAAAVLGIVRVVIHDPDTVVGAVNGALDDPAARTDIEAELAAAIDDSLFGDDLTTALAAYGIDIEAEARRIAPMVLDDAAFRAALNDLAIRTHERILIESTGEPLDMTEITAAVRAIVVREIPDADGVLPAGSTLYIVTADQIPDLTGPLGLLDRAALAVTLGGLLLPLAYLTHPERHRVVTWVGRWLLLLGLTAGSAVIGVPWMAARVTGSPLVEVAVRDLSTRLLAPAAVAGIVGIGLAVAASLLKNRSSSSATGAGVAAALGGFDDPWPTSPKATQDMELAHRGLVDVSHPLTNI